MLLALSTGLAAPPENAAAPSHHHHSTLFSPGSHSRKRFRTKFTQEQKEKMLKFAEKVGWKMQKRDDDSVHEFCNEIGVHRSVNNCSINISANDVMLLQKSFLPMEEEPNNNNAEDREIHQYQNDAGIAVCANGSSSSS